MKQLLAFGALQTSLEQNHGVSTPPASPPPVPDPCATDTYAPLHLWPSGIPRPANRMGDALNIRRSQHPQSRTRTRCLLGFFSAGASARFTSWIFHQRTSLRSPLVTRAQAPLPTPCCRVHAPLEPASHCTPRHRHAVSGEGAQPCQLPHASPSCSHVRAFPLSTDTRPTTNKTLTPPLVTQACAYTHTCTHT